MRKALLGAVSAIAIALAGCSHSHEAHEHEGHDHAAHSHEGHDHATHSHEGHDHSAHEHEGHDHAAHSHEGHDHSAHEHEGHDHAAHNHEGHDHAAHEHEGHKHDAHGHDAHEAADAHADGIHYTAAQAQAVGLATETVTAGAFASVIRTNGDIAACPVENRSVVAPTSGIVTLAHGAAIVGAQVRQGDLMATISSRQMQDGDPVTKARLAYETAKSDYDRAAKLVKDNIVSQQEFEQARLTYETAKVTYDALASSKTARGVAVKAPVTGYVQQVTVTSGQYVSVGTPIATMSDNGHMMLVANVSQRHRHLLPSIKSANIRLANSDSCLSLSQMGGKIVAYGRAAEGGAYIPISFEFHNNGDFMPGMFAEVFLLSAEREGVISVPTESLTEEQGLFYLFVSKGHERYEKREVRVGQTNGLRTEITHGLSAGEVVVTHGAHQLRLAAAAKSLPAHSHNH